jgi:arylsulfatase A-like enzyme
VPTPNLRALMQSASYTLWGQTVDHPYVYTLPSHVSMLTGVSPDRHGITWNEYIEESYPNVPTLFDLAKRRGLTTGLASGKMKFITFTRPGAIDWTYLPPIEPVEDAHVAAQAIRILREHQPNVMLVHLPDVDTWGHEKGWGSPEQLAAVARADAAAGQVLAGIRDCGMEPSTLLIATADHGGAGLGHWGDDPRSRTIPWIARGPGVRRNQDLTRYVELTVRTEDTFATACAALGIPIPADNAGRFVEAILESRELLRGAAGPATLPAR